MDSLHYISHKPNTGRIEYVPKTEFTKAISIDPILSLFVQNSWIIFLHLQNFSFKINDPT